MTKAERIEIKRLVGQANKHIEAVHDGALCDYINHDQWEGYIWGASYILGLFATLYDPNNIREV